MTHPWHDVTPGESLPAQFMAVIEIPAGSKVKYQDYKTLEGKVVEVDAFQPAATALPVIEEALERYSQERRRGFS